MNCPDCRNSKLEIICTCLDNDGELIAMEDSIYKCPKCKQEYNPEDLEE